MNVPFIALAWRTLWRDVRSGELRLLIVAVTLAVAALSAVGFFADRLQGGLQRDARQLLGGDAVVSSDNPTPATFLAQAQAQSLQTVATLTLATMGRADEAQGGASKLVALKAVVPDYPLRGNLRIASVADEEAAQSTREIPAPGTAWVDPSLLESLNLKIGDSLLLGDSRLRVTHIIATEPDRGGGFMSFSPRVMVNQSDMAATGLIQPASRVNYRFAVAGTDPAVQRYVQWATEEVKKPDSHGVRIESLETGRPEMRQTLDRANKFLNLVALLSALLSAVAVALAARGFAANHLDDSRLFRSSFVGLSGIRYIYKLNNSRLRHSW